MQPLQTHYFSHRLGVIVGSRIGLLPLPQHVGILAPHPTWGRSVISFKPDGIVEEPAHQFAAGRPFDSASYPSNLPWEVVVQRARHAIAIQQYYLINFNCDYFVRHCHGMKLGSPQVTAIGVSALIGVALVWAAAA